jgi:proteic killer suppression protein
MIKSFRDKATWRVFNYKPQRRFPLDVVSRALAKLLQLHRAAVVDDLRVPPGNRLEALKGDRAGQLSIRVNDQWRICFEWRDGEAWQVEIVDYH